MRQKLSTLRCVPGFFVVTLILGSIGCADTPFEGPTDENQPVYRELRINHQAILLSRISPYDTVQLISNFYGKNATLLPAEFVAAEGVTVQWESSDSSKVRVSSNGFLTALGETQQVFIHVSAQIGQVTQTDQVEVRVTNESNPRLLTHFAITPTDSLKRAAQNFVYYRFPIRASDASNTPITDFPVRWRSSHPKVAGFVDEMNGLLSAFIPTQTTISASTLVYGVAKTDSFVLQIGYPVSIAYLTTEARQSRLSNGQVQFVPVVRDLEIGPGGRADFQNNTGFGPRNAPAMPAISGVSIDVLFDDPSVAKLTNGLPGGNILGLLSDTTLSLSQRRQLRLFTVPGEHFYTIQPLGVRGKIVVHDR